MNLTIPSVKRSDVGIYTCTVDNGIENAIVKTFRLEVNCELSGRGEWVRSEGRDNVKSVDAE